MACRHLETKVPTTAASHQVSIQQNRTKGPLRNTRIANFNFRHACDAMWDRPKNILVSDLKDIGNKK